MSWAMPGRAAGAGGARVRRAAHALPAFRRAAALRDAERCRAEPVRCHRQPLRRGRRVGHACFGYRRQRLDEAFTEGSLDLVFHLASIPGGLAEARFELGLEVNLQATVALLELLRRQVHVARLVFASTIAAYGTPMPAEVDDEASQRLGLSYAAHKRVGEILIEDYSRRGWLEGISLRLPGVVARPPEPSGLLLAFMSEVFWRLKSGEPSVCPVSPEAVAWWMSVGSCVDNQLHADAAEALGFAHDGDVDRLIERAINP